MIVNVNIFFFKFIDATHWLDCGFGTVTAPLGPQSFDVKVRVGWLLWSLRMEVTFGEGEGTKDEPAHLLTLLRMNEQSTEASWLSVSPLGPYWCSCGCANYERNWSERVGL